MTLNKSTEAVTTRFKIAEPADSYGNRPAKSARTQGLAEGLKHRFRKQVTMLHEDSPRAHAIRGSLWMVGGFGLSQLLRLASNLVLTRLLFPEVFGLMSLVLAFMQGLAMFSDIGLTPSIVRHHRGDDLTFLNTAWTIQVARGFALWVCCLAGAYPFSIAYDNAELALLIPVAGFTAVIAGFNSMSLATASRRMNLRWSTLIELASQCVGLVVMILGAMATKSVWALVIGTLTSSLAKMLLSHIWFREYRNRFAWCRESVQALNSYGKWIFVSTLLTFCVQQSDRLVFGKMIPLPLLGVYSIAVSLAAIPNQIVSRFGRAIAFPAFSRAFRDNHAFGETFARMRFPVIILGGSATCLLAIVANPMIQLLYDSRYQQAAWMLQILCVGIWFQILECHPGNALLAMGLSRSMAIGNAAKLVGMLLLIPAGFSYAGFTGALAGYASSEMLRYGVSAWTIRQYGLHIGKMDLALTSIAILTLAIFFSG